MTAVQFAVLAAAGEPSEERASRCMALLDQFPVGPARGLISAQLEFAFWQPGALLSTPEELGLPKRLHARQLIHCAPHLILRSHLEGFEKAGREVKTLGRWSRSAAASLGWRWLLANEMKWRQVDPALGDAFRAGAMIPAGESLSFKGQ
jgi:hypothetical protein